MKKILEDAKYIHFPKNDKKKTCGCVSSQAKHTHTHCVHYAMEFGTTCPTTKRQHVFSDPDYKYKPVWPNKDYL